MKGQRLKELREEKKLKQSELAKILNISSSSIGMYETDRREPDDELKLKIANYFNVSVAYLMNETDIRKQNTSPERNKKFLPVLGIVKAGYNYLAQENVIDYIDPAMNIPNIEDYFGLVVKGDSMSPMFDEGDYLIVNKTDNEFNSNDICIILINSDEATIKKVVKTDVGIELHAFNHYYPVRKFTYEEMDKLPVKVIGIVVRQIRNWK